MELRRERGASEIEALHGSAIRNQWVRTGEEEYMCYTVATCLLT